MKLGGRSLSPGVHISFGKRHLLESLANLRRQKGDFLGLNRAYQQSGN